LKAEIDAMLQPLLDLIPQKTLAEIPKVEKTLCMYNKRQGDSIQFATTPTTKDHRYWNPGDDKNRAYVRRVTFEFVILYIGQLCEKYGYSFHEVMRVFLRTPLGQDFLACALLDIGGGLAGATATLNKAVDLYMRVILNFGSLDHSIAFTSISSASSPCQYR